MKKPVAILGALCVLSLSACETPNNFGEAVHQTIAAQTSNPDAPDPNVPTTMNGQRAALGQARYSTDNVKQPESLDTLVKGGGGNSSSSGSSDSGSSGASTSGSTP